MKKGDRLYVEGRIEYSTSGEGDQQKFWTDVIVQELIMLGGTEKHEPAEMPF